MRKRDTPYYWVYRIRGFVMAPLLAVMLFSTWREIEFDALVFPLGGAIFALGLALRIWAQMHLHYRLSVRKHLTTTGPYRYLRNPIYIGNMLILVGLCVTSEILWFLPAVLLYSFVVYSMVVRHEEAHLTQKYGDAYRDFMVAVPRWLPATLLPKGTNTSVGRFFLPSVRVELYNFLFLAVPLIKEFVIDRH